MKSHVYRASSPLTRSSVEPGVVFIVDDGTRDPAVERMLQLAPYARKMNLSDLLRRAGFSYSQTTRLIHGTADWSDDRLNFDDTVFVNRVIEVSDETVMLMTEGKGGVSRGQISYCYQSLLSDLGVLADNAVMYSTLGKLVPLVTQWRWVSTALPMVGTPNFVWGYGPELVDISKLKNTIFTSPLNLYQWRPNTRPVAEVWDEFVMERPAGRPLLTTLLGSEVAHGFLDSQSEPLDPEFVAKMNNYTAKVRSIFAAQLGEILWFVESGAVTFASFSHALYASATAASFDDLSERFLSGLRNRDVARRQAEWSA